MRNAYRRWPGEPRLARTAVVHGGQGFRLSLLPFHACACWFHFSPTVSLGRSSLTFVNDGRLLYTLLLPPCPLVKSGCARSQLPHVGFSSLTREGTQAFYIGSMDGVLATGSLCECPLLLPLFNLCVCNPRARTQSRKAES